MHFGARSCQFALERKFVETQCIGLALHENIDVCSIANKAVDLQMSHSRSVHCSEC